MEFLKNDVLIPRIVPLKKFLSLCIKCGEVMEVNTNLKKVCFDCKLIKIKERSEKYKAIHRTERKKYAKLTKKDN